MICVSLRAETAEQAIERMRAAHDAGADLCELRIDYLKDLDLSRIIPHKPLPVIATVRPVWEGGRFAGTEADRIGLLEDACLHGADYVDVEFRAYKDFNRRQAKLVVSWHDFEKTPADIASVAAKIKILDPFLVKVACLARNADDLTRLVRLQKSIGTLSAVIAMGETGEPMRTLYAKYGGWLTYAAIEDGEETAPGQLTVADLARLYRSESVDDATNVYAVIGNPVAHSRGPGLFNDMFRRLKMNARYVKIRLEDVSELRELAAELGIRGLSVTIPHKQAVLAAMDSKDDAVIGVGAANTIVVRDGRFCGYNTDAPAAVEAIRHALPRGRIYGMRALVLGAGGVARAIAWGLRREGARVTIANRTFERARALADEFGCSCLEWGAWTAGERPEVVVNATSVGMKPNTRVSPVEPGFFTKEMVVLDTVYTPRKTKFLEDARAAGAQAVDGVEMYLRQADLQFRLFTGRAMPPDALAEHADRM